MAVSDVIFQAMGELEKIPILNLLVPIGSMIGIYCLCQEAAAQLSQLAFVVDIVSNISFLNNSLLGAAILLGAAWYFLK